MDYITGTSCLGHQIFVISGVLATILSCGLGLGFNAVVLNHTDFKDEDTKQMDDSSVNCIESVGEFAFVPAILLIPYIMQKKGRRMASITTAIPLIFGWLISFNSSSFASLLIFNVLHHISLGGAVAISSVIIAEFCSPKHRGTFLMLETAMISLGVLVSHVAGMMKYFSIISVLGLLTALYNLAVMYYSPESPYWLVSQGYMVKCTQAFHWLRGIDGDDYRELEDLLQNQNLKLQLEALRPIKKMNVKEKILVYLKSLLKLDFLKPLSIMILLFSFVGFGSENVISNYTLKDFSKLTNGKYIGTIILDILSLICALTACVLIQIVKRKTLFIFTGSISTLILAFISLLAFLQSVDSLSKEYTWIFLSLVTGFVMFLSLGTTALPFSLLGEIFPMTYKGVGSSLTCAYLWALGNTVIKLMPTLTSSLGLHGVLILLSTLMFLILLLLNKIMPETNPKTLLDIEKMMKVSNADDDDITIKVPKLYDDDLINSENNDDHRFDKLKLCINV